MLLGKFLEEQVEDIALLVPVLKFNALFLCYSLSLFVSLCGGNENYVHTANLVYIVIIDFGENQLFLEAHRVVTATVEA